MKIFQKLYIPSGFLIIILSAIFINGCNKDNVTNVMLTDDQYLQSVVTNGYSASQNDEDNLMSYETSDLDNGGAIGDNDPAPMSPIDSIQKWGRKVTNVNLNFGITNQGDTVKVVNITRTITGNYIILGYSGGQLQTITKPYTEVFYRHVSFKRVNNSADVRLNWRLYTISILSGGTTLPQVGNDKVSVTKVELYVNGATIPNYTFNGPDFTQNVFTTRYFGGNGIPVINRGSSVKIKVYTISQDSPFDYVAWHWERNTFGFHRIPFTLESQTGSGPYSRVYSRTINVYNLHKLGAFNGYLSASTHESLFDTDPSKFASSELGFPYLVIQ